MAQTITNIKLPGFSNGATITQTGDYAVIAFTGIDTADHVVTVFDVAARIGAKRGVVFTGKVVDDHLLAMYRRCAATGTAHLGGRVTQLSPNEFRLDFDEFPILSQLRSAMTNTGVDDVTPGSRDFINLCAHLNSLVRRDNAACAPDLFSGGFKFSDEIPADFENLGDNLMPLVNLLRCLWGYRASIVGGNLRQDLAPYWDAAQQHAPHWAGFTPERSSVEMKIHVDNADRHTRKFIAEIERIDRNLKTRTSARVQS